MKYPSKEINQKYVETVSGALEILSRNIQSQDGVANACCREAAILIKNLWAEIEKLKIQK